MPTAHVLALSSGFALGGAATAANPGDVLWFFQVPAPETAMHRPSVGADGTIYWNTNSLHAITPGGQLIWSAPGTDSSPVGIGQDGSLYVAGWQPAPNSHLPALRALSSDGQPLWDFHDWGLVVGIIGGPNVGPDGNVYAVGWGGGLPNPYGFGAFSLTPGGSVRWHVDGFAHQMAGVVPSEIVFSGGNMYKTESRAPMPSSQLQSGLVAIELDGDIDWQHSVGIPSNTQFRQPAVSPLNGNVHQSVPSRTLRTFSPSGSLQWYYTGPYTPTGFGGPAAGPDGSVYVINGNLHVISLDASGSERWTASNVVPNPAEQPAVSPDGKHLVFGTHACFGAACPGRIIALNTSDGSVFFDKPLPNVPGGVPTVLTQPRFSTDGSVVYVGAESFSGDDAYLFAVAMSGVSACYANCDGSTGTPALNVADFGCFLSKFAGGDPYANCDGSTMMPVLNVSDFGCFLNKFAAGCS